MKESIVADEEIWGPLSNVDKTVLKIDSKGELDFSFNLEQTAKVNTLFLEFPQNE